MSHGQCRKHHRGHSCWRPCLRPVRVLPGLPNPATVSTSPRSVPRLSGTVTTQALLYLRIYGGDDYKRNNVIVSFYFAHVRPTGPDYMRVGFHALVRQLAVVCPWKPGGDLRSVQDARLLAPFHGFRVLLDLPHSPLWRLRNLRLHPMVRLPSPSPFAWLLMCVFFSIRTIAVRALLIYCLCLSHNLALYQAYRSYHCEFYIIYAFLLDRPLLQAIVTSITHWYAPSSLPFIRPFSFRAVSLLIGSTCVSETVPPPRYPSLMINVCAVSGCSWWLTAPIVGFSLVTRGFGFTSDISQGPPCFGSIK